MRFRLTLAGSGAVLLCSLALVAPASADDLTPGDACPSGTQRTLAPGDPADRDMDGVVCMTSGGQSVDNNAAPTRPRRR